MTDSQRTIRTRSRTRVQRDLNPCNSSQPAIPCVLLNRFKSYWTNKTNENNTEKRKYISLKVLDDAAKKSKLEDNDAIPLRPTELRLFRERNDQNVSVEITISNLPIEILSLVFRTLPCGDRNNVRLVCRTWYNACNTISVTNTQNLVCPTSESLLPFMVTLENSRLKWLNVEFRNTNFVGCRKSFWSRLGYRIKQLQFVDCELNKEIIACVNKHCSRVERLSWEYRSPDEKCIARDRNHLYPKLISKTPFLNVLTSLHIHVWNVGNILNMDEGGFLIRVLAKYPNLRALHVKLLPSKAGTAVKLAFNETLFKQLLNSRLETLTFVRGRLCLQGDIPNIDALPANYTLRELRFSVWKCESKVQTYFVQKFLGLKHLEFHDIFRDDVLQDIWKYQTGLTSIILNWLQCSDYGFSGEVNHEEFDEWYEYVDTSKQPGFCVSRLSKLEKMKIILVERPDKLTENVVSYFIFPNLRFLDISLWTSNIEFTFKFLRHLSRFKNLEELRINYNKPLSYYLWMKALRTLKKLRKLIFIDEELASGFGDRQYKRFFSSLPQLKCLEHQLIGSKIRWTRDSLLEEPKKTVFRTGRRCLFMDTNLH